MAAAFACGGDGVDERLELLQREFSGSQACGVKGIVLHSCQIPISEASKS
jgi:hypothetical protein